MRRYQPAASADRRSLQDAPPFLINRPAVVYYRQSSAQQIGNTSTALQLIDLPNYLQSRGWVRQDILIIDDDAGVSGSLPIDHRIGMSKLLDLIVSGKIGTVACQQVDRLFRDPTQIEVNRFIDACSKANVRVLTPVIQYDFTGPNGFQMARQFRFEAELAAEFHYSMVQARLQSGRQYFAQQGCWIGGSVPVGFILDQRRRLPDGSANPLWRKLVPFEPYAQVVRSYFDLFLVLGGCIRATANQIRQAGPYYPDFLDPAILKQVPDGFQLIAPRGLKQREGHYFPTEIVLSRLLTRIVYLGHWAVRRQIVRWNNHPALVDEQIFAQAFNYLSPFALDGSANPDYCPYDKRSLTVLNRQPRPLQPTLCGGLLQTVVNGQLQPVEVVSDGKSQSPSYALTRRVRNGRVLWHWKAASVDREVADWFLAKLEKTFLSDDWARVVGDAQATLKQRYNECVTQLDRMEPAGKAIRLGIDHEAGADVESVPAPAQEQEYLPLHAHLVRLAARLDMYGLTRLQQTAATALQRWEQMDSQQQRLLLAAFVSKMIVSIEHREFVLSIHWKDGSDEQLPISIHRPGGRCWSRNEITLLRQLLLARAAPAEMASAFSHRAWESVLQKSRELASEDDAKVSAVQLERMKSYWRQQIEARDLSRGRRAAKNMHWQPDELQRFHQLVSTGTTQLELASAFPLRTWGCLSRRMKRLGYPLSTIADRANLGASESYQDYCERCRVHAVTAAGQNADAAPQRWRPLEQVQAWDVGALFANVSFDEPLIPP